jgi:hypothetical protein
MILGLVLLAQVTAHGPEPGPRRAQAGVAGFQTVSKLDFGNEANRLTAAYVFPDRARWHFENYSARVRTEHQYYYRLGERLRAFDGTPSRDLEGAERDGLLLQMELRRAVLFWPDGFSWSDTGPTERSAPVHLDSCCSEGEIGSLVATLEAGRPSRIEGRSLEGAVLETLEIGSWQEDAGRSWPRTLILKGAQASFTETIESIDPQVHFLEVSFLPPDRRPLPAVGTGPRVLARDIVAMTYQPVPLTEGVGWTEALASARAHVTRERETLTKLGLELDPVPMFEVDSLGQPRQVFLRLTAAHWPAPAGFLTVSERPGLFLLLGSTEALGPGAVEHLIAGVPEGALPGVPYARIHARKEVPVELVLPFGSLR